MNLEFRVSAKIRKPVAEVFEAVVNPNSLSAYFATGGASARLEPGATVIWQWHDYSEAVPVQVRSVTTNAKIVLEWQVGRRSYASRVEIQFEALGEDATLVQISESGWRDNQEDLDSSYNNCQGWTQMLDSLKVYLEHGIRLREFYF